MTFKREENMPQRVEPGIFKAYDIRGLYPKEINEDVAYLIGRGLCSYLKPQVVCVGRDVRLSSPVLLRGLVQGIVDSGADVVDLGIIPTDCLYFAVGHFRYPAGVVITASHNPKEYNGFKICRENAIPLSGDAGLNQIKEIIEKGNFVRGKGTIREMEVLDEYIKHLLSFIDIRSIKPLRVAIDAGNGVGGIFLKELFRHLPCEIVPLYFEPDGNFPNHLPNPIDPGAIVDLRRAVLEHKCDLGAAFDGDADRVFLMDERGEVLNGGILAALVAKSILIKNPGSKVVYNIIASRVFPETVEKYGGVPIKSRVGHAFIKPLMREHNAIFGGEHSGHFYFRDNFYADSGSIAFLIALELISKEDKKLSQLVSEIDHYVRTPEINFEVKDIPAKMKQLEEVFLARGYEIDKLDGITVSGRGFWFNLRPSNTEPLIRMNLEAENMEILDRKKQELTELFKEV